VSLAIKERNWSDKARKLFHALDVDGNGFICLDGFIKGANIVKPGLSEEEAVAMFGRADESGSGNLDYNEFLHLLRTSDLNRDVKLPPSNKDERGIIQIDANKEKYFGETLRKYNAGKSKKDLDFMVARSQHFSQELYETRIASLQRYVAMTVMFHQMGKRVQEFFAKISFGLLGHRKWGWTSCESNLVRMVAAMISRETLNAFILAAVRCKDGVTGFLAAAADLSQF
jgi:hypothetical protein